MVRIQRIEKALGLMFHSKTFTMPDGTKHILYRNQIGKGYYDARHHIDSVEARILLSATDDGNGNGGKMLQLLKAVLQ
jgi:hypothetical protein